MDISDGLPYYIIVTFNYTLLRSDVFIVFEICKYFSVL